VCEKKGGMERKKQKAQDATDAMRTLVYWHGILGIPGKGANWMEPYQPNKTIGELMQTLTANRCGENNKRIEIFKFQPGHLER
jgi:hypothetical protein